MSNTTSVAMNSCSVGHIEIFWRDGRSAQSHKCPLCRAWESLKKTKEEIADLNQPDDKLFVIDQAVYEIENEL